MVNKKHNTKDYINIALYYLMSKKDYDSITVTDICEKAHVSRMSFYRYYNNKDDIFINYCDERFEELFKIIHDKNINDVYTFLYEAFSYVQKYVRQIGILKKAKKENLFLEKCTDYGSYLAKHIKLSLDNDPTDNKILATFLAGGIANLLLSWNDLKLDTPPEEMAVRACKILNLVSKDAPK